MSIQPKDLVEYAHGMLQPEGREVEHRNVVNRAYYGAFLAARDLANITGGSGSVHLKVIEYYRDKKSIIGNNLDDLKRLRQVADYEPQKNVTYHHAKKSCRIARKILRELES
ncbi:MAG: hypothetical protein OXI88_10285 [Gammaproteobacteria bacterium]|nr:hypothetical protein [Gammaproteobacteria bacterium]MDE0285240.1 hypothetical protein [Gammaproteobacteria bacterium]MDE0512158.1 hypothetical protein [Gammaproteobacteria bacterium]